MLYKWQRLNPWARSLARSLPLCRPAPICSGASWQLCTGSVQYVHASHCGLWFRKAASKYHRDSAVVDLLDFSAVSDSSHINLPLSHISPLGGTVTLPPPPPPPPLLGLPANCHPLFLKRCLETLLRMWRLFCEGDDKSSGDLQSRLTQSSGLLLLPSLSSHPSSSLWCCSSVLGD